MSKNCHIVLVACTVLTLSASVTVADPARFVQKDFCISIWVTPPNDDRMPEHYRQMADANFTVVLDAPAAATPEKAKQQLDLFDSLGLKAIIQPHPKGSTSWSDGPACIGYQLKDEPTASFFSTLAKMVAEVRAAKPGKLAFVNLYPQYANERQLGTPTYDEHVRRFIEEVKPDVLCFDYYPMLTPKDDGRKDYCANLDIIRQHALKAGIPFWNFFNIMPFGSHYDPTEAQVVWQIYTSLAYGAKGVLYFCYWTPTGGEFPKGGAIITADGRPTRHYDQARRINAKLKRLGPTLMKLTSTNVIRIKPGENSADRLRGTPLRSLTDGDYLVGVFDHADGRKAVLLNNYNFAYTAWPTVEFNVDADKISEVDPQTGKEIPLRDDSPAMAGVQISLDAGEGRLFLIGLK